MRSIFLRLGIAACSLTASVAAAAMPGIVGTSPQAVVLVPGRSIVAQRLPAFLQIEPGRFVAGRAVTNACVTPQVTNDSLLAYFPELQLCVPLNREDRLLLQQRVHELTGRWPVRDLAAELDAQPFVAIVPPPIASARSRASCTCPQNHAPTGSVQCNAQTRTADTPIGTVTFSANDVDGDALSGAFSYQRDADPVQAGLPGSLASSCTNGSGSLQCTVNGTAPGPAGIVQLSLSVSDGSASLPLQSLLEVLAPVPDRIFSSGFEYLGCP